MDDHTTPRRDEPLFDLPYPWDENAEVIDIDDARGPNPSAIGDLAEAAVLHALVRAGRNVLQPFGNRLRYDLVVHEADGTFSRIQVKTGQLIKGGRSSPSEQSAPAPPLAG